MRILLVVAGLSALAFGIANEFSNGWQLDIVNLITIVAAIVLIVIGVFAKLSGRGSKSLYYAPAIVGPKKQAPERVRLTK